MTANAYRTISILQFIRKFNRYLYKLTIINIVNMKLLTPQEIEVWYILPAVRRELAKIMISTKGMSQKQAAKVLYLTEPAISQYLKEKRGKDVKFNNAVQQEMKKSVDTILANPSPSSLISELQRILKVTKQNMILFSVHKKIDSSIPHDCNQCVKWW